MISAGLTIRASFESCFIACRAPRWGWRWPRQCLAPPEHCARNPSQCSGGAQKPETGGDQVELRLQPVGLRAEQRRLGVQHIRDQADALFLLEVLDRQRLARFGDAGCRDAQTRLGLDMRTPRVLDLFVDFQPRLLGRQVGLAALDCRLVDPRAPHAAVEQRDAELHADAPVVVDAPAAAAAATHTADQRNRRPLLGARDLFLGHAGGALSRGDLQLRALRVRLLPHLLEARIRRPRRHVASQGRSLRRSRHP